MSNDSHEQPESAGIPFGNDSAPPTLQYADSRTPHARRASELTTVATFADSWEASLALGKLEAAGIHAVLADENIVATGGSFYSNITGGVKLRVLAVDAERALAVLPSRVRARIVVCPRCGATDTRPIELGPGVKILFLLLLGIPYLFVRKSWACISCGNVWVPAPMAKVADEEWDDDEEDDDDDEEEDEMDGAPDAENGEKMKGEK
jgi:hypothetical protein